MNKVGAMTAAFRAQLFGETATRLGLPESLVEKDFWVCWTLKQLFSIGPFSGRLLFKGGTSLSKVFGAINRFSEDIDLAVDYTMLGFTGLRDPRREGLSRTKQQRLLVEMLEACQSYIRSEFLAEFRARCLERLGSRAEWDLMVDGQDPNLVRFQYPRGQSPRAAYVVPQVLVELGTYAEFVPRDEFTLRSFAAAEFPELFEEPEVRVTVLLAKRTFWEKATILHAEHHRPEGKLLPGRYSRHYYDVAMLSQGPVKADALGDLDLLARVVRHKQTFYPAAWARYDLAVPGSLRLVPAVQRMASLRQDYRAMEAMIFGEAPKFESLIELLAKLEREVNALGST